MLRVLSLHLQELSAVKVRKSGTGASPRAAAKPRTRTRARGAAGMLTSPALGRLGPPRTPGHGGEVTPDRGLGRRNNSADFPGA